MDGSADAAAKRANDFGNSFFGMPGYADDSLFFLMRYGHKAETTMSKAEYKGFMDAVHDYNKAVLKLENELLQNNEDQGSAVARSQNIKELKDKATSMLKDYPDLERDFDRFVNAAKTTFKAANST